MTFTINLGGGSVVIGVAVQEKRRSLSHCTSLSSVDSLLTVLLAFGVKRNSNEQNPKRFAFCSFVFLRFFDVPVQLRFLG